MLFDRSMWVNPSVTLWLSRGRQRFRKCHTPV